MEQTNGIIHGNGKKRKHRVIGTVIKVNGRTVGQVVGDTFVKDIANRHMLTTPPAIANNIQALHDAERAGALFCEFTNTDTGIVYRAPIAKIWDCGKEFNFGWGDQIYLTLSNWTQTRDPQFAQSESEAPAYSEPSDTGEIMPLKYTSHAPVGVKYEKATQLTLFGRRK
jgi:hypothetical protein